MSINYITASEILSQQHLPLLDVRSPIEFNAGHIPHAINLPLFTDEERASVGTLYKEKGSYQAILLGLEFAGKKLKQLVETAVELSAGKPIYIHCWRGGQRSKSVAWLFDNAGLNVSVLSSGYKSYRQYIHEYFARDDFQFLVLSGRTGSAKTIILQKMKEMNEQVLDLESLADHKGSAFGWIGEKEQPTNEQFENNLFTELSAFDLSKPIWIENESRTIGKTFIPEMLWSTIKISPLINIKIPDEDRLQHLLTCYDIRDKKGLIISFEKIVKRLGHEQTQKAIELIDKGNLKDAAEIALRYYDKCYDYNLNENKSPEIHHLNFNKLDVNAIATSLINYKNQHFGTTE
jgi:tRNA 2-selenouridine synthase